MTETKHPFSERIIRNGRCVIEIHVFGLTSRQWDSLVKRCDGQSWCHHISDIRGLLYVTSRRHADVIAKLAGRRGDAGRLIQVECRRGKIDTSGISYQFEEC